MTPPPSKKKKKKTERTEAEMKVEMKERFKVK